MWTYLTQQIPFKVPPKSIVSYAIDDWTDGSWKDLYNNVTSEQGVWKILGKPLPQSLF